MNFNPIQSAESHAELTALIQTLNETQRRIFELTGGQIDAVSQLSGAPNLLPQAQDQLRRSEAAQRHFATERAVILDALPAHIALLDSNGVIIAVNKAWRDFAEAEGGSACSSHVGVNYLSACENATGRDREDALATAKGIRSVMSGELDNFAFEYPCHSPTRERWFELRVSPLPENNGVVIMHIDETARIIAERESAEIANRLETLIHQAKIGIWVIDSWTPILANDQAARIFGYASKDDLIGLNLLDFFADEEQERVNTYKRNRLAGRQAPDLYRVKAKKRGGEEILVEIRAFAMRWGERMTVCAMISDVTEQNNTEEKLRQSQRLEAVGQLTGGIAHDFNNLLTVILGNAELLAENLAHDPHLLPLAQMAKTSAERGAELTHRLLAFARRQTLQPEPTDVKALIANMSPLLQRTLGEHIALQIENPEPLNHALIDSSQLENAILNLCINARDAMPNGGTLSIKAENVAVEESEGSRDVEIMPGDYVRIVISDTGIGMDEATLAKAFVPFFTTKEVGKGTGLGLSMVFGFAKQSGGYVKISSQLGQGTSVFLYLPKTDAPVISTTLVADMDSIAQGNERILLTEDDALVRKHVGNLLETLGYRIVAAANGPEALDILQTDADIDLLFTDIVMPNGMTGYELADEARELRPGLPVLFTSGYNDQSTLSEDRLKPGMHLLKKPYRRQELAMKIREVIQAQFPVDSQ